MSTIKEQHTEGKSGTRQKQIDIGIKRNKIKRRKDRLDRNMKEGTSESK
jgi:hypothetical protein